MIFLLLVAPRQLQSIGVEKAIFINLSVLCVMIAAQTDTIPGFEYLSYVEHGFSASRTSPVSQSAPGSGGTQIIYDHVDFNVDNWYNAATGFFTSSTAGMWWMSSFHTSVNDTAVIRTRVNGADLASCSTGIGTCTTARAMTLAAGDQVANFLDTYPVGELECINLYNCVFSGFFLFPTVEGQPGEDGTNPVPRPPA